MFASDGQARVIAATRALVRRRGYAEASLRQIAAEAGYSPAGLYAHFPGREAILDALADEVRHELLARLVRASRDDTLPAERLVEVGMAYIGFALEHPAEFELLFRFARSRKKSRSDPRASALDFLRTLARAAAPKANEDSIDAACLGLWSTVHGLASLRMVHLADFKLDWDGWSRRILRSQAEALLCSSPPASA